MSATNVFVPGGYRYIPAVFQYSGGVAAEAGFEIERARFQRPVPIEEAFNRIESHLQSLGRPLTAFCQCELRSPAPFTEDGFRAFNRVYVGTLERWGIFANENNPVARSNVCPAIDPPPVPSFYAFSYTVPARSNPRRTFVIAGSGEAPEGKPNYRDFIVRRGDVSPEGLREKARFVLGEQERRMALLGFSWRDVTSTHVYSVHDIYPLMGTEIIARGAAPGGATWHYCRPPVVDLDYEMDCRGLGREVIL
jgi:hypothetical protein